MHIGSTPSRARGRGLDLWPTLRGYRPVTWCMRSAPGVVPAEVQVRPGRRRSALSLIPGAVLGRPVRMQRRRGQPEQAQLTDLHPRPQGDRQVRRVRQLQGDVAGEPGSMKPAVEWVSRPSRPSEDLPSSRPARGSGRVTCSNVEPSTNSPGCSTKAPSVATSTRLVNSSCCAAGRCGCTSSC